MKRTEHSWMYERKVKQTINPEFVKGVDEFIQYVKDNLESSNPNEVRCPCAKCKNKRLWDPETVKIHLFRMGFIPNYYEWMCHGEGFPIVPERRSNEYREMVFDAFGHSQDQGNFEQACVSLEEEPNAQAKHFLHFLKASERPLYEGSSFSVLEMTARITSLKYEYNLPHRCVNGFVSLLSEAIPDNNHMADTFYEVKKIVKGLELPHERIHVFPKGCMLFWKDDAQLSTCRACGSDRYKQNSKGSLVLLNVLFYFPITPRLQRLFTTKNISEEMTWHSKNPRVQGTMAHPSDSEAWKHLDSCFPEFTSEPRNVRLGLYTDGFALHDHPFRNSRTAFCKNKVKKGAPLHIMSGEELWECVKDLPKATNGPKSFQRLKKEKNGWFKQSILLELPYWKHLLIRHNLDVMLIEKNFFDKLIHTVMDVKKHMCDTPSARNDIAKYCKRPQLHLQEDDREKEFMPRAPFALDKAQRKVLCEWVK
ncbi:uncharacterized protein LOC110689956 [Chenopodium quinoa]|uniref:uncharacterized protein LOC110689956 n=1 Tax=Chenopodium quinoa TaxID=63459 RepID=UPI000B79547A|nr:uncharacterized protein LOC110689956 [Chenopodium quinoa]